MFMSTDDTLSGGKIITEMLQFARAVSLFCFFLFFCFWYNLMSKRLTVCEKSNFNEENNGDLLLLMMYFCLL